MVVVLACKVVLLKKASKITVTWHEGRLTEVNKTGLLDINNFEAITINSRMVVWYFI